ARHRSAAAAERLRWYQRTRQSVQRPEHAARSGWHAAAPRRLALPVNGAGRRAGGRRSHRDLRRRCAMNATRGTLVRLAVLVTPALACNLDRVPTAPGTPIREPHGITAASPHIGVEHTYLVRGDAAFQKVADVDAPGVRISVAQGSSPDIYLGRTLKYATLVRTPATPQALDLLGTGQVDA